MVADLMDYRMKKYLARIDGLVAELVLIRRYICSAKMGFTYCQRHVARGVTAVSLPAPAGNELAKKQELLLFGLRQAEKRTKRQLVEASRELATVCGSCREIEVDNSACKY